jgi:hypothetical protein
MSGSLLRFRQEQVQASCASFGVRYDPLLDATPNVRHNGSATVPRIPGELPNRNRTARTTLQRGYGRAKPKTSSPASTAKYCFPSTE